MNRSWYIFYGLKMNMTKDDVLTMRYGEMQDLLSCLAIEGGGADQIVEKRRPFADVMRME